MKNTTNRILILILLATSVSCTWREEQAKKILSKEEVRKDILNALLKDSIYLSEFLETMSRDSHALAVLKNDKPLLKIICSSPAIDSMIHSDVEVNRLLAIKLVHRMEEDTASCQLMCGMVMENPVLRRHLKENICPEVLHRSTVLK